ncbi:MAG: FtsQ-type POTRA domain-containing protein [Syntrophaceticus sp.]
MSPSTKRRKGRRKNRDRRKPARFLKSLLLIILSVLAVYYFSQSPFFALKKIEVKGNMKVTQEEIVQKSGLSPGINYFEMDTELIKKRLSSIPLVETVTVKKHLPDRVVINIKEREPLALFCVQDSLAVIDGKGYCLEKCTISKNYNLPIITGLKPKSLNPGERVSESQCLEPVLAVLDEDAQQLISEINLAEDDNLVAYTRQGIPVLLGNSEKLPEKLDFVASYLDLLGSIEGIEYIDIRSIHAPAVKCQKKVVDEKYLFSLQDN